MAIIVTHVTKGGRFVVLGANFTRWESAHGHWFLGNLDPVTHQGTARVLTVCGPDGKIQFGDADAFTVVEIDGRRPNDLLGGV